MLNRDLTWLSNKNGDYFANYPICVWKSKLHPNPFFLNHRKVAVDTWKIYIVVEAVSILASFPQGSFGAMLHWGYRSGGTSTRSTAVICCDDPCDFMGHRLKTWNGYVSCCKMRPAIGTPVYVRRSDRVSRDESWIIMVMLCYRPLTKDHWQLTIGHN